MAPVSKLKVGYKKKEEKKSYKKHSLLFAVARARKKRKKKKVQGWQQLRLPGKNSITIFSFFFSCFYIQIITLNRQSNHPHFQVIFWRQYLFLQPLPPQTLSHFSFLLEKMCLLLFMRVLLCIFKFLFCCLGRRGTLFTLLRKNKERTYVIFVLSSQWMTECSTFI